ncbi:MAG: hypothetical protein A2452_10045 [Candidatus Firestonebacteria bacterium RIFOXYC2_FULL_39_67]|nr:MAG: hypothetical protein A2536_10110 [Candidatus Firestonebacteria bacterium RIFOXYD2_FULL_39_29]OGF55236.1 MAG: hypothetical protein A2452_10045 [Candidatus Firestonebacteria bacterium RIFOXYC2_FULL_39_67]
MASILIVDDEKNILESLKILLGNKYDLTLCDSGCKALENINKTNFDIVLTDMKLGDISGTDVLKRVKEVHSDTDVIIMSAYKTKEYIFDAGKYGAFDYLYGEYAAENHGGNSVDECGMNNKLNSIRRNSGRKSAEVHKPFDKDVILNLIKNLISRKKAGKESSITKSNAAAVYTDEERKVMKLLLKDKSNKEIACVLNKNETYVKNVLRVIFPKMGVKNRPEAKIKIPAILN